MPRSNSVMARLATLRSDTSTYQPSVEHTQFTAKQQSNASIHQQIQEVEARAKGIHHFDQINAWSRVAADLDEQNKMLQQRPTVEDHQALQNQVTELQIRPTVEPHNALESQLVELQIRPTVEPHNALESQLVELQLRPTIEQHRALKSQITQPQQRYQALRTQITQLQQRPTVKDHVDTKHSLSDALDQLHHSQMDLYATADTLMRREEQSTDLEAMYLDGIAALQRQLEELHDQKQSAQSLQIMSELEIARMHKESLKYKADVEFSEELLRSTSELTIAHMHNESLNYKAEMDVRQDAMEKEYADEVERHKITARAKTDAILDRNIARQQLMAADLSLEKLQTAHASLTEHSHLILAKLQETRQTVTSKEETMAALQEEKSSVEVSSRELSEQFSSLQAEHATLEASCTQLRQQLHDSQVTEAANTEYSSTIRRQLSLTTKRKDTAYNYCGTMRAMLALSRRKSKARARKAHIAFQQLEQSTNDIRAELESTATDNAKLNQLLDRSESTELKAQEDLLQVQARLHEQSEAHASATDVVEASRSAAIVLFVTALAKCSRQAKWHQSLGSRAQLKIGRLENKAVTADRHTTELKARVSELDGRARDEQSRNDGLESRIQCLETRKAELSRIVHDLTEHKTKLEDIALEDERRKAELEKIVRDLTRQKTDLNTVVCEVEVHKADLEKRVRDLESASIVSQQQARELQSQHETQEQMSREQADKYQTLYDELSSVIDSRTKFLGFIYTHFDIHGSTNSDASFCDDFDGGISGLETATNRRLRSLQAISEKHKSLTSQIFAAFEAGRSQDKEYADLADAQIIKCNGQIDQLKTALRNGIERYKTDVAILKAGRDDATAAYDHIVAYLEELYPATEGA